MSYELRLFCIGAAAVIDTALLLSISERSNWRRTAMPIATLTIGVWLLHCGEFANLLLLHSIGDWAEAARWGAMSAMSAGLLLMPSALLHGVVRIVQSGFAVDSPPRRATLCSYLPLLATPLLMDSIATHPGEAFLERVASYHGPYISFAAAVNLAAVIVFHRQRARPSSRELRQFLLAMEAVLCLLTGLLVFEFFVVDAAWRASDSPLIVAIVLLPAAPIVLFAYLVIRYRFMRLVVERTLVYGVILASALLFHHLILQRFAEPLADQLRIDIGIFEGIIVFLLVLMYQPFRQRVGEALQYLMGRSRVDVRQRTRALAVEMWQHVGDKPEALVEWFVTNIKTSFQLKSAAAWLFDDSDAPFVECCNEAGIPAATIVRLHQTLASHSHVACRGPSASNQPALDLLTELNASLAIRVSHERASGLLLLGRGRRAKELGEEETNAILLLVELFAVTLHNHYLQQQQTIAERRAAQNEKLSTLGLLTSSITHEIKNPLSSIKTIAALLAERCGPDDDDAESLNLILEEVDRLTATTTQFLKFARPASGTGDAIDIISVFQGVIHVLSHLAKQHNVQVEAMFQENAPAIAGPEDTLRQIVFNLVLNAIEATPPNGHVRINVKHDADQIIATISDDGVGISDDIKEQIFDPFVTSKTTGTGLGLYVVRRNIEELEGTIACHDEPAGGTCFTIKLPLDKLRCDRGY
ncbi:MAG: ATP-binding protein [Planctomycetota bacterium]|nr:ATP-binding protein [Planctomycetota bacterium]